MNPPRREPPSAGGGRARRGSPPPRRDGGFKPRPGAPSGGGGGGGGRRGPGGPGPGFAGFVDFDRQERPAKGIGGEQVEGRQAVRELLLAGRRRAKEIFLADWQEQAAILSEIEQLADEARTPVRRIGKTQLDLMARTEHPQGVIARASPIPEADYEALLRYRGAPTETHPKGRMPFLVVVDGVTDPQNLGALLRSAEGAGVTGVVLPRHRSVHVTPSVTKAAAGAVEHLPIALVGGLPTALLQAKQQEAWVVGLDADGATTIYQLGQFADSPLLVVVGAEGAGMSRLVRERCDVVAAIPLRGAINSLNAATAGAIALFELGRQRA